MSLNLRRTLSAVYQTRRLLAGACVLAALVLGGCQSGEHGKYTEEHKAEAAQKMAMLKSGTEWQMAHSQFLGGDMNKSLKTVDRSIALDPRVPKSHLLRGRILLEMGRLEDARESFLASESLDPNYVDAQYYLGIVYERVAQPAEALIRYKRAMELDTGNAQYLVAASEMLIAQEKYDEAEQLLNDRKQYFQYNAAVRQTLGHIAMLRNEPAKAAQYFNEAMLLAPGDTQILEDLVHAQVQSNEFADAEVNINKALESDTGKDRRDLKELRARCLLSLNRPVDARTVLLELTSDKEGGRDQRSWTELGRVAVILKDRVNLRQAAARVQAIAPENADGYVLRAMFCRLDNRPEDALEAVDGAIARAKSDSSPYVLQAMILKDMGRQADARKSLATALKMDAGNQQAQHLLSVMDGVAGTPESATDQRQ